MTWEKIEGQEWNLFIPQDTPSHISKEFGVGGNCGVHVCTWELLLATCSYIEFIEGAMQNACVTIEKNCILTKQIKKPKDKLVKYEKKYIRRNNKNA